tara:strand:+ start:5808 stop:6197 length:390 start_codon:yes stop_codon:yes gene_type:complete
MKKCINCDNTTEFNILCNGCDAVTIIASHIKTYNPSKYKAVITYWYENSIFSGAQLLELAIEREARKMKILAKAIIEQEAKADYARVNDKTVMNRAMDYCWKGLHEGPVTANEVTDAIKLAAGGVNSST